ncbi:MAG: hypothetical protein JRH18_12205 [Deltaproteobacteria bacterium]|nr:hypothetical protein [Deltaproteobacteria bacterium]MBW2152421.1 hypothetical protein [Deltaproteobacteria bacterium]
MKKIVVLDADMTQCQELCRMLEDEKYPALPARSLKELENHLNTEDCLAVFMDVDTVPVTNRDIRTMAISYPGICFFCISRYRFHPELRDAICYHVYACLNRPIDPDELYYWVRSIYQDDEDSNDVPGN